MNLSRIIFLAAAAASLTACSLGGLLGGGKAPPTLLRLTPEAAPVAFQRSANAGEAVTVNVPVISKELRTVRVPAQVSTYDVQYLTDLQWIDTPDRLFQELLAETIRRRTNRVVLNPKLTGLDPGLLVNGQINRFGYDNATGSVIVQFDGALSTQGGTRVETRRFEASIPSAVDRVSVGAALNRAANQVAIEVAGWVGGGR
ncbi:MAG: ABC-type transport auxiliary lipoprotein family protein [Sphingomicrobium sp.]